MAFSYPATGVRFVNCLRDGQIVPYIPTSTVLMLGSKYPHGMAFYDGDLARVIANFGTVEEIRTLAEEGYPLFPLELISPLPDPRDQMDIDLFSALHDAAKLGKLEMVEELIQLGTPVNIRSSEGRTAFSYAAENKHLLILKALLRHRASEIPSPEEVEMFGVRHPILYAAQNHDLEMILFLLELNPTSISAITAQKENIWHIVISESPTPTETISECLTAVTTILKMIHARDSTLIDAPDQFGSSPLQLVFGMNVRYIGMGDCIISLAQLLLQLGSKTGNTFNRQGYTSLDYAIETLIFSMFRDEPEESLNPEACKPIQFLRSIGMTESKWFDFETGLIRDPNEFIGMLTDIGIDEDDIELCISRTVNFLMEPVAEEIRLNFRFTTFFCESLTAQLIRMLN